MIIINKFLPGKTTLGMTLYPFILLRNKNLKSDEVLINHEKIHLRQQLELLIIPFYVWYGLEFLIHYLRLKNKDLAYRKISFEQETYTHERDLTYLKKRRLWAFSKYL